MTFQSNMDASLSLGRQVAALYESAPRTQTLGAWVLETFYPGKAALELSNGCDFVACQRTSDARLYLAGALRSGELAFEPLLAAVPSALA